MRVDQMQQFDLGEYPKLIDGRQVLREIALEGGMHAMDSDASRLQPLEVLGITLISRLVFVLDRHRHEVTRGMLRQRQIGDRAARATLKKCRKMQQSHESALTDRASSESCRC